MPANAIEHQSKLSYSNEIQDALWRVSRSIPIQLRATLLGSLEIKNNICYKKQERTFDRHTTGEILVQGETKERWKLLCEQAATEQDSHKLVQLIQEINDLLEKKRLRVSKKEADAAY